MFELHEKLYLQESDTRRQDTSKAALGDELDGDTVCVEVGAAQGKLICAIGLAVGRDVDALDGVRSAWKSEPMYVIIYISFIHQKRISYLIRIAEDNPKDLLLGLLMLIFIISTS